ncbi:MAG: (Fe-S)-binding protein [Bacteroidaceae bacterium]|nr:(Fe-S)-binding protein [Bacteroidaceae bacterium]
MHKINLIPYNSFVLPFIVGSVIMLIICLWKYIKWIKMFSPEQRSVLRKNWLSWKIFPAVWEMIREGLLHFRIFRRNVVLGIMHQAYAFGWFLLIVVGAMESMTAVRSLNQDNNARFAMELVENGEWFAYSNDDASSVELLKEQPDNVKLHYKRPLHLAIFYRYFVHSTPPQFKNAHVYSHLMDGLLLYVFLGLTLAIVKMLYSRIMGMRSTTKHTIIDRFSKFALWMIFPLRFLAESVTASLYGNGGFCTMAVAGLFDPVIVKGMELSLWTFYSVVLAIFFVTLPFTRYMHIFTELLLIYFRRIGMTETEHKTGYSMFQLNACSRCGICIDGCPLNSIPGHKVQAVYLIRAIRMQDRASVIRTMTSDCLMCGQCAIACPVQIDITALRKIQRNKGVIDTKGNYSYLQSMRSPFNAVGRVAYFGGCMSHLTPGIVSSMEKIFNAAGVKYWHMDKEAGICCGRPLSQQGFFNQASELREKNSELIKQSEATMLVTSCPICYQSFVKEYNLDIPVVHHTEFIDNLISEGKLRVNRSQLRTAYHDPCELGRGMGVYDPPRRVLAAVSMPQKVKMERENSICCGFNLGNTVLGLGDQTKVRNAAVKNLTQSGAETIVTACPMCKKAFLHNNRQSVRDIAEIVADNII